MSIQSIHNAMAQLHQSLGVTKTCVLMYPADVRNSNYKSKQFVVPCNTSTVDIVRMKSLDSTFSIDGISITIILEDLNNIASIGSNPVPAKDYGFKDDNVVVKYKGNKYIIKKELLGEYENTITLHCDIIS